ncbi:MAG: hypothetical protein HYX87_01465 [Chloroflexi bacterium]|nr:hypothetical protein [Chloroflexota bacterium]
MSQSRGLGLRLYITLVIALGTVVAVVNVLRQPMPESVPFVVAAMLAALVGLAGAFPVALGPKVKTNVVAAPAFAAVLLLHPVVAATVVGIGVLGSQLVLKRHGPNIMFNTATSFLYVGVAGLTYRALNASGAFAFSWPAGLVAVAASGAVFYTLNRAVVSGAAAIQKGAGVIRSWLRQWREDGAQELALLSIGLVAALTSQLSPWSLVLLVIPVFAVQKAFAQVVMLSNCLEDKMKRLLGTQAQLAQAARTASLGTFACGIGHQINNPIFAIRGRTELLLDGAEKHLKTDEARESLKTIQQMADRVAGIARCMLVPSRASDDGETCTDVNEALDTMLNVLDTKVSSSKVTVLKDYQENLSAAPGEAIELQEAFGNLISNACDAMPQGGILKITTKSTESRIVVEISDTGVGIPEENIPRLFDPFFTTKKGTLGFGLGLYVVKSVIEARKGRILVESQPGKGSTFRLILPAVDAVRSQNGTDIDVSVPAHYRASVKHAALQDHAATSHPV